MDKEDIHLGDIKRILLGDVPPEFLFEVFCRTLVTYTLLLIIVRWLGKRMAGQLSITEMSVMIMLGAIVSAPMQMPDRGLLQGALILLGVILLQRGSTWLGVRHKNVEHFITGKCIVLVKNGVLQLAEMEGSRISRQQVFAQLRSQQIYNLGKVKRVYMEACGKFSIFEEEEDKPGLSVYPATDTKIVQELHGAKVEINVCSNCGNTSGEHDPGKCKVCNNYQWVKAVSGKNESE